MSRLLVILLLLVSACAPVRIMIPEDAPIVRGDAETRLNARVGVSYKALGDQVVGKRVVIRKQYGQEVSRHNAAIYLIAPASRAVITKALKKVFAEVTVIEGKIDRNAYDIIVVPQLHKFDLHNRRNIFKTTEASVEYKVHFLDGYGKRFGDIYLFGDSKRGVEGAGDLAGDRRAIVQAMEDAVKDIIEELPKSEMMAPWRSR